MGMTSVFFIFGLVYYVVNYANKPKKGKKKPRESIYKNIEQQDKYFYFNKGDSEAPY
jgi:hypothetical protein